MTPVPGHPYVSYAAGQGGWTGWQIHLQCGFCGDRYVRDCQYPQKTTAWISRYSAQHAHGIPGLRDKFAKDYHLALHALRQQ